MFAQYYNIKQYCTMFAQYHNIKQYCVGLAIRICSRIILQEYISLV